MADNDTLTWKIISFMSIFLIIISVLIGVMIGYKSALKDNLQKTDCGLLKITFNDLGWNKEISYNRNNGIYEEAIWWNLTNDTRVK